MPEFETHVALVGLGRMGTPMALRLQDAGYPLIGFDASAEALASASRAGITTAGSAAEAIMGAKVVILMLPSSDIVEAVIGDADVAAAVRPGQRVIDMGSSEPTRTTRLGAELAARGVELYDAPVSGGVNGAMAGTLTVMAGGEPDGLRELTPLLSVFGRLVVVGPLGSGHAIKALNNLLSATHLWATSEAVYAAQEFGVEPDVALAVFNSSSGRSGSSERKWPDFIRTESYDSGFALSLMLKDVGIATGLLDSQGRQSAVADAVRDGWAAASAYLGPSADHTEVAKFLRLRASGRG
ncbi:NAD(P)-dependent oxidoreductase [Microbacterium pseudoresistens]|uniref:3-hydroxyisobutyrate dehydrogenase n=1 Tax=Microbacterium pseudoresistens TaxID=640634 RepID=A0A7Y9EUM8_9MICO|nr:NAD(P)-dependent oxidoreductase [Microbacterium pseudoresistens]NYD54109.1 3-hydroxyisobutyrate dehydrogenase [Microbacterium pseudoresistens]